jgi:acyl-CoA hydrolase
LRCLQVVWSGRSSLDIRMELRQQQGTPAEPSLAALFSFVALDPVTKKAIPINPLQVRADGGRAGPGRAGAGLAGLVVFWGEIGAGRRGPGSLAAM